MHHTLSKAWRISEDAVANPVGGETVILHLGNGNYFGLDTIGTLLWEGIKAGKLPAEICKAILDEYDVEAAVVEEDIARLLDDLSANELVEPE